MDKRSRYTTPVLKKGTIVEKAPKNSSIDKEQAKKLWYVQYFYEGKRFRVTEGLNRFKDHIQKQDEADKLLASIKKDLAAGYNPNSPTAHLHQLIIDRTTLIGAIQIFKDYHIKHKSRPKTISTYLSKLNALSASYPGKLLSAVTTRDLEKFLQSKIDDGTYSHNSVKSGKRIFNAFFATMIKLDYIKDNPKTDIDAKIKSNKQVEDSHMPYSDDDLKTLLTYLDANDPYCAFFSRMIYFTCIRPSEIRALQVKHINLSNGTIRIPHSIKKVTSSNTDDILNINDSFIPILQQLNLSQYPKENYLTGSLTDIVGERKVGENTPYNRLVKALKILGLDQKGYDLYSFKHTSNIKKYLSGWTLAEIMEANRHTSLINTETYLKKLGLFTDSRKKAIPLI
jgi:integrase